MASDSGSGQASLTQIQLSVALLKAREAGVPFYIGWQTSLLKHINVALASAPAVDRAGVLEEALKEIVEVASGEKQVANDDTEGMEWVDKRARRALAHQPAESPDSFEGTASGVPKAESVGVHADISKAPRPRSADAGKELRAKVNDLPQIRYVASGDDTEPSGYYVPLNAVLALLGGRDKELRAKVEALLEMDCEDEAYQAGYQTAVKAVLALLSEGKGNS